MTARRHLTAPLDASIYGCLSRDLIDEIAASFGAEITIERCDDVVVLSITAASAHEVQNALTEAAIVHALAS